MTSLPLGAAPARARAAAGRTAASTQRAGAPRTAPARPALRLVAPVPAVARRIPFAIVLALTLGGGLVALLLLHTLAAQDAFTVRDLQHKAAALSDAEQQLALADQQASAPGALAARARELGLVPATTLKIVHRRDGRIVAVASAPALPPPAASPAATTSAKPSAPVKPAAAKPAAAAKPRPTSHAGTGTH